MLKIDATTLQQSSRTSAATGVGGINRDIFTMGARPIAQLNSLRFGKPTEDRTKWLVKA